MRIRLTLDIERRQKPTDDGPAIYDLNGGNHERAPRQPIGFTAEPGRAEPEWEDRR